ncbi:MAG: DUF711 family protein [Chloroflexi bacterium]|nr:DUF711 family protein [Chloroflexota bacterium]
MITLIVVPGATISPVKIRAVTLGLDLPAPEVVSAPFTAAARFLGEAKQAFESAGIQVQTMRVAGPDLGQTLGMLGTGELAAWAAQIEAAARGAGIDYLALGRMPAAAHEMVAEQVAPMLAAGEISFVSADLMHGGLPSVAMAAACARAVKRLAESTPQGFGNLRFAASAHCPPNIPFLPAAYHVGGVPRFAIAVEAADVVVQAVHGPGGMSEIEDRLVGEFEAAAEPVERVAVELAVQHGFAFVGIDLSPAPFPSDDISIVAALERAGVDRFGAPGTLYVAAMVTRAIRRTKISRCGFSGLMLPVLEDSVLARRAEEHPPSLHELLLYSAVCGTGLDTVPLPQDVSEAELAGAYLDVAALSLALNGKPLTARLLPVPGAAAGDSTTFTFDYFRNTKVLPAAGVGAAGILGRGQ